MHELDSGEPTSSVEEYDAMPFLELSHFFPLPFTALPLPLQVRRHAELRDLARLPGGVRLRRRRRAQDHSGPLIAC